LNISGDVTETDMRAVYRPRDDYFPPHSVTLISVSQANFQIRFHSFGLAATLLCSASILLVWDTWLHN